MKSRKFLKEQQAEIQNVICSIDSLEDQIYFSLQAASKSAQFYAHPDAETFSQALRDFRKCKTLITEALLNDKLITQEIGVRINRLDDFIEKFLDMKAYNLQKQTVLIESGQSFKINYGIDFEKYWQYNNEQCFVIEFNKIKERLEDLRELYYYFMDFARKGAIPTRRSISMASHNTNLSYSLRLQKNLQQLIQKQRKEIQALEQKLVELQAEHMTLNS